jgi:hypothetical protein
MNKHLKASFSPSHNILQKNLLKTFFKNLPYQKKICKKLQICKICKLQIFAITNICNYKYLQLQIFATQHWNFW